MLVFVNEQGQTLVTRTSLRMLSSFTLPELDQQLNALVVSTQVTPRPVLQVQGSLGNKNYLNLFGEDPMPITVTGIVVGGSCNELKSVQSALGVAIGFYSSHGVINRPTSLKYTIKGQATREAFLVGLQVSQDSAFADFANFTMMLLAENLQKRSLSDLDLPAGVQSGGTTPLAGDINSDGVIDANDRVVGIFDSEVFNVLTNGDTGTTQTLDIISTGFNAANAGLL
jgi:hypothetical protein